MVHLRTRQGTGVDWMGRVQVRRLVALRAGQAAATSWVSWVCPGGAVVGVVGMESVAGRRVRLGLAWFRFLQGMPGGVGVVSWAARRALGRQSAC